MERKKKVAEKIRSKNDNLSLIAANEAYFRREESVRQELVKNMIDSFQSGDSLGSIINLLINYDGMLKISISIHLCLNMFSFIII